MIGWRHPAFPAILLATLVLAPFLNKAFTLDDPVFLLEAAHVAKDPLHPASVEVVWTNNRRGELAHPFVPDARIAGYLLLPVMIMNWQEWFAHLLVLAYFLVTILGTTTLAKRLGLGLWGQHAAATLVASAPVMLGMAGTVFPDIPAAMFAVWGVERLYSYRADGTHGACWAASLLLALACLSRIHVLGLLGLAVLWALASDRRLLIPLTTALGIAVVGIVIMRDPGSAVASLSGRGTWSPSSWRLTPNAISFGIAALTTTPFFLLVFRRRRGWEPSGLLWLWLLLPIPILTYVHYSAKYFVPVVPAMAILVAAGLEPTSRRTSVLTLATTVGVFVGLLVLSADARMANAQRWAAETLIRPRVASGERVWYAGHWGFHWYAERSGAIPVTVEAPWPSPGEILISSSADEPRMLCFLPRHLLQNVGDMRATGRVMSKGAQAGFYSNFFGTNS